MGKVQGYMNKPGEQRIFGFNNPDPTPGSPNYGYKFWITAGPEVQAKEGFTVKEFAGGLYAVTRCPVHDAGPDIPTMWKKLVAWREGSKYRMARQASPAWSLSLTCTCRSRGRLSLVTDFQHGLHGWTRIRVQPNPCPSVF